MLNKPTFNVTNNVSSENKKEEIGAIWDNSGKMNIRFKLPKSKILELIESSKTDDDGNVLLGFTAFPNKSHNGESKRPKFRIYERSSGTGENQAASPTFTTNSAGS